MKIRLLIKAGRLNYFILSKSKIYRLQRYDLHPQFFNLSPTNSELLSGVVPKIYILETNISKVEDYLQKYKIQDYKNNRFKFVFNQRRNIYFVNRY